MWPLGCSQGQNLKGGRETPSGQQRLQAKGMSVLSHAAWAGSFLKKASPRNSPLHKRKTKRQDREQSSALAFPELAACPRSSSSAFGGLKVCFWVFTARHGPSHELGDRGKPASASRLHKASARAGEIGHRRHHGLSARRCLERHLTLDGLGSTARL